MKGKSKKRKKKSTARARKSSGRKQSARARKPKRKAARKRKTAAKKKTRKGRGPKKSRLASISITNFDVSVEKKTLKQSDSARIHWKSKDSAYHLNFLAGWPFNEPPDIGSSAILVPAGGTSNTFTVSSTVTKQVYPYQVLDQNDNAGPSTTRPNPVVDVE